MLLSHYWDQALVLWKTNDGDPTDVDGLLRSYWELETEGKVSIDAVRLLRLNRAVDALPALDDGWRILEGMNSQSGDRGIIDAKHLMFLVSAYHTDRWSGEAGRALDGAFLFLSSDDWQMQRLAALLLCQTLRKYPAVIAGALDTLSASLLT